MSKISITIDVAKISKEKITERKYINKNNVEVVVKEYKVELVELREPKVLRTGDTWILKKTHFLAEEQTKEERESKVKSKIVGDGFQFVDRGAEEQAIAETGAEATINTDDIPF